MHPHNVSRLSGTLIFLTILMLGLAGWFRLGELIPDKLPTHPEKLIRRGQLTVFRPPGNSPYMRVWLYRSKGDRNAEGVPIFIPAGPCPRHCPIAWTEALLRVSSLPTSSPTDPLFTFPNGKLVLKRPFITWLKRNLTSLNIDPSQYSGHSLRIGAAVSAARNGMAEQLIQTLGRWRSDAYLLYIKYIPSQIRTLRTLINQMGHIQRRR